MIVYIIYTSKFDKYYVGECEDFEIRLAQHNTGFFKSSSTTFATDWELKLIFHVNNRMESRKIELYIKSMKSKKFIERLINETDFRNKFCETVKLKFNIEILLG
jgi:putative endonuclease